MGYETKDKKFCLVEVARCKGFLASKIWKFNFFRYYFFQITIDERMKIPKDSVYVDPNDILV